MSLPFATPTWETYEGAIGCHCVVPCPRDLLFKHKLESGAATNSQSFPSLGMTRSSP